MPGEPDRLRGLLEALPDGVAIVDAREAVVLVNVAARAILGIESGSRLRSLEDLDQVDLRGEDAGRLPRHQHPLRRALHGERFTDVELTLRRPGAEPRQVTFTGTSTLEAGRVTRAMILLRDVTEARRVARLQEDYVAHLAHDLGGPARAVRLIAASARSTMLGGGKALDRLARIERNAERLLAMVASLREFAPPEGYAVALRRQSCHLAERIQRALDRLDDASRARIALTADTNDCTVLADPLSIDRALHNLIEVALLHSKHVVDLTLRGGYDQAAVEFANRSGNAVDVPERTPHAFDGAGIALYIAHRIAEMHGGHVAIRGDTLAAATFRLVLPRLVRPDGANGARAS